MGQHVDWRDVSGDHDDSILKEGTRKVSFWLNVKSADTVGFVIPHLVLTLVCLYGRL